MEEIRWGLIGCGDIAAKRVAAAIKTANDSKLVAACRRNPEKLSKFAADFEIDRTFTDWKKLVQDREINAVYIATPVYLHEEQTIGAAERGLHVLCEKPMAMNMKECARMMKACEKNKVSLGIAYYRHFYPVITRIKELLESGEIGKPVYAEIRALETFDPEPSHPRHWIIDRKYSGGGPLKDFGCHRIEVLLNLFGRASAVKSLLSNSHLARDVEDTASVQMEFENGVIASLVVSHAIGESRDTLSVYCRKGSLHVPSLNMERLRILKTDKVLEEAHPPCANLHLPLVEDFIKSVKSGKMPGVGGRTGLDVEKIINYAYTRK